MILKCQRVQIGIAPILPIHCFIHTCQWRLSNCRKFFSIHNCHSLDSPTILYIKSISTRMVFQDRTGVLRCLSLIVTCYLTIKVAKFTVSVAKISSKSTFQISYDLITQKNVQGTQQLEKPSQQTTQTRPRTLKCPDASRQQYVEVFLATLLKITEISMN